MENSIFIASKNFEKPYTFILTKITIYSFEEFLYHIFHFPKSFYDFDEEVFKNFIRDEISLIDSEVVSIATSNDISFNKITDIILKYSHMFDSNELSKFQERIVTYSEKNEKEFLKDIGSDLLKNGEYIKAKDVYETLLEKSLDCDVLNNYSYACIKMDFLKEAESSLLKACDLYKDNRVYYNYIKLLLQKDNIDKAIIMSEKLDNDENYYYKLFLQGIIKMKQGEFITACTLFEDSLEIKCFDESLKHFIKLLIKTNKRDKALSIIDRYINKEDINYYRYKADVFKSNGQIYEAIATLEEGLGFIEDEQQKVYSLVLISRLYRENYDFKKATKTIRSALVIKQSSTNSKLLLELALINKGNGNLGSYKDTLDKLLESYKGAY